MTRGSRVGVLAVGILLLGVTGARAVDRDEVKKAIDRGVTALKRLQGADGTWPYVDGLRVPPGAADPKKTVGLTALAGLTLVECEVSPKDPAVRKAADFIRQSSVMVNDTYSLALDIMFLDLLREADDEALIQSLTVRLLAGQNTTGGWTYDCPPLDVREARQLMAELKQRSEMVARGGAPRKATRNRDRGAIASEVRQQVRRLSTVMANTTASDNSNTQFATLALWVARRHRLPVDKALVRVEKRFRATQNADGGWPYVIAALGGGGQSTPSMTCAGLLGMAVGHGVAKAARDKQTADEGKPRRDPTRDPVVRAGLLALGSTIGHPVGNNGPAVPLLGGDNSYYFLWSLERVAVAYGLETIGKKDWYSWGTEILLKNQGQDGGWHGKWGTADTCFGLLFLRRANLAKDLSATLKGQVTDPGEVTLRSGGVASEGIHLQKLEPAIPGSNTGRQKPKPAAKATQGEPARPVEPRQPDATESASARLSAELVRAPGARQGELIEEFKTHKGPEYTEALVGAIHKLDGETREKVRDALAERLTRMTAATLRDRLQDPDREMRSAAALACGMKEDKTFVPDLINLLTDPDGRVAQAARVALESLTGKKGFGPRMGASPDQRAEAAAKWRAWWRKQQGD